MTRYIPSQRDTRILLSLVLLTPFLLHAVGIVRLDFIQRLEQIAYDARVNLTLPRSQDTRVVIVDIDEASLRAIGQWPWPRDTLARLIDRLFADYDIRTLGFDVVFAEPDRGGGVTALRRLADGPLADNAGFRSAAERLIPELDRDRAFARAIDGRNVVLGYFFRDSVDSDTARSGRLPAALDIPATATASLPLPVPEGYGANLELLQEAAVGAGFFDNPLISSDGIFRRVPLVQRYDDALYELLALATARAALGSPPLKPDVVEDGDYRALEAMHLGERRIPVDPQGGVLVPYRGPQGSFPYVSAKDVLDGTADPEILEDRIVLVGATAAGLLDLRTTPVQSVYPGVEVHANVISGILDGDIKHRPGWIEAAHLIVQATLGLGLIALLPLLSPLWLAAASAIAATLVVAGNLVAWSAGDLVLPLAAPLALVAVLSVFHVAWGFFVETRGKRQLTRLFGQYVPPELVDEMNRAPETISLAGESREMTVLFSDVRGFTGISEQLAPDELTRLMNAFLTPMTRVIHQHRGTIDKYMGDAIMAFWGAPLSDPDHARHALLAARDLLEVIEELGPRFEEQGWPPLEVGIGLNTGVMNVGNMGSEFRMAYTALGDAVNLGSRLEGLTRTYGVPLIVSESTRAAVSDFVWREIDVVRVKGKEQPVAIHEPVGLPEEIDRATKQALRRYHAALERYRACDWDAAEIEFQSLALDDPERLLYALYLSRISLYRKQPPPDDWDGVFTHSEK